MDSVKQLVQRRRGLPNAAAIRLVIKWCITVYCMEYHLCNVGQETITACNATGIFTVGICMGCGCACAWAVVSASINGCAGFSRANAACHGLARRLRL